MNELWMRFLYGLNGWTVRQMHAAVVRRKVRWFRQELARQIGSRN
jgi:hypothetical protein